MKKTIVLCLAALVLFLTACGSGENKEISPTNETQQSEAPTATANPTPDFSETDFSGNWHVSEIIDSNGLPVTDAEKQNLGASFMLELLPNSTYFVYDQDSKVLGQGTYSVVLNQLILTTDSAETAYEIVDADTLRVIQPDTSITVMTRDVIESTESDEITPGEDTGEGADGGDTGDTPGDIEDEPTEDSTPTPDSAATDSETADSANTTQADNAE